ncbi:hypothetical protein IJ531_06545 [bacterium]|nr:hypothetical protein [bacterium]
MNQAHPDSSLKLLFLLNVLLRGEFSKNEIIEEFKKNNFQIQKTTVGNYIQKLKNYNIPIVVKQIKNINYYSLDKKYKVELTQPELNAAQDVKKLILSEKNPDIIKKAMRIFYKFALFVKNKDTRRELADFGYYSKINWLLVKELENHCRSKNIITIDYIMPDNSNKYITLHANSIKPGDLSERLYLTGIFKGDNKLSQLPIDRIYTVKKVVEKNAKINIKTDILTYKISKEMFDKTGLDDNEELDYIKDNIVSIKRQIKDIFFTLQRLLYFCPDLYYISDPKIKELVKEKLYNLKDMYSNEFS